MKDIKKDEKLINESEKNYQRIRKNSLDYDAFYSLVQQYSIFSRKLAIEYYHLNKGSGVSVDELQSVCMNAIYIAVQHYQDKEEHKFYPYWKQIAQREMVRYLNENSYSYRASTFSGIVSLDAGEDDLLFAEAFSLPEEEYKTQAIIDDVRDAINENKACLNEKELCVIKYMLDGYSQKEVSILMSISKAQVCGLYHSSLEKLKNVLLK